MHHPTRQRLVLITAALILCLAVGGVTAALNVSPGRAATLDQRVQAAGTKLVFSGQPRGGNQEGQRLAQDPSVAIQDQAGQLADTDSSTIVTLAITTGTGAAGAVLSCDNDEDAQSAGVQVRAAFGTVPFFGCRIDKANPASNPYTLTASAAGLTSAVSNQLTITAAPVPTATATATATPTQTPTATPTASPAPPPPAPVTQAVGAEGGDIKVGGGVENVGGVTVRVPAGTLGATTYITVAISNTSPSGVTASGAVLLPKTIEVTTDTGAPLGQSVELDVHLTAAELGGRDIGTVKGGVVTGATVDPRPTRVISAADRTLGVTLDHFSKFTIFAITNPGPGQPAPPNGATLSSFDVTMTWSNPPGTTQYHLQVVPFNGDGPGVNVLRNADTSFAIPAPPAWYGLLPDMTYFWRVRTSTVDHAAAEAEWTAWGSWTFRTPRATSDTIAFASPASGATVTSMTPTLTWSNTNLAVFYYEVQVSKDSSFNTDPATATAMVYWVLLHGGVTTPANSYALPKEFPLEPNTAYNWRVRPRVQGDGVPVPWSAAATFRTP